MSNFADSIPFACCALDEFFRDQGFDCREQSTSDSVRWRDYFLTFKKPESNVLIRLILRFELNIGDSPDASYDDNHQISFDHARIDVFDRCMPRVGSYMGFPEYDEDKESKRKIDSYPILIRSLEDLNVMRSVLGA